MRCLQVECWAETKLVKTSKCLEPRGSRQGGEAGKQNYQADMDKPGYHGCKVESDSCQAGDPEALLPLTAGNQRPARLPVGSHLESQDSRLD
jgi:hypothetical protein